MAPLVLSKLQAEGVAWMRGREDDMAGAAGGILAEDAGAGKTAMLCALMRDAPAWPTLVVVPNSMVWEWFDRVREWVGVPCAMIASAGARGSQGLPPGFKVLVVAHSCFTPGPVSASTGGPVAASTPSSDKAAAGAKGKKVTGSRVPAVVRETTWARMIVDEADVIRNPRTGTHINMCAVEAAVRWAVTATPVQNSSRDLVALAKFVGARNMDAEDVCEHLLMRRGGWLLDPGAPAPPASPDPGGRVPALPEPPAAPKGEGEGEAAWASLGAGLTFETRVLPLLPEERERYDEALEEAMRYMGLEDPADDLDFHDQGAADPAFEGDGDCGLPAAALLPPRVSKGGAEGVSKGVWGSSARAGALRQRAHGLLARRGLEAAASSGARPPDALCLELALRCSQACTHAAILYESMSRRHDVRAEARARYTCLAAEAEADPAAHPYTSSKFEFLCQDIMAQPRGTRCLVFCDWVSEMRLLDDVLAQVPWVTVLRLEGALTPPARQEVLHLFGGDGGDSGAGNSAGNSDSDDGSDGGTPRVRGPRTVVLLVQIRCGGCGLNLQCATRVYLLRPQVNPAVEYQAIARAHRRGQHQHVTAVRLVSEGTVDEEVLQRQQRKRALIRGLLGCGAAGC